MGRVLGVVLGLVLTATMARGQDELRLPPAPAPATATDSPDTVVLAPTHDNPEATVAEAAGPIAVGQTVSDEQVQRKLQRLLPQYPGVRQIDVRVSEGVVTLTGHVEDAETRDRLRDFVRRVEGVSLVLNQTKTDTQVLTARELAAKRFAAFRALVAQRWLAVLSGLLVLVVSVGLARLFWRFADSLLAPLTSNVLLRSVLGSIGGGLILAGGFLAALWFMGLTETVLPGLGLAGVVALALSFAFRDIAENFIASILLGTRRPFRVGDFVELAGFTGVVKSLNTRATILVTLEGHQVRIPNATVFKATMVNRTASSSVRGSFDVIIPYEVSTTAAQAAIAEALRAHDGILPDPPARALVEGLDPTGVRLRAYFWFPARGIDAFKLQSDARLRAKVALQDAGIAPPPTGVVVSVAGPVSVNLGQAGAARLPEAEEDTQLEPAPAAMPRPCVAVSADQARDNLRRDAQAAASASTSDADAQNNELERVLDRADEQVGAEGENLIGGEDGQRDEAST